MKILHIIPGLSIHAGGPSRSVSELCAHLAERDVEVFLARAPGGKEEVPLSPKIQAGYFDPKTCTLSFNGSVADLSSFDIIHSHGIWTPFQHAVTRFAREHSLPLVVSPRGMLEPWALKHKWLKKKIAWWLFQHRDLKYATALHATAQSEADQLRRLGFKQPIAVIPNGVMLPEAAENRPQAGWIRDKEERIKDKEEGRGVECPLSSELLPARRLTGHRASDSSLSLIRAEGAPSSSEPASDSPLSLLRGEAALSSELARDSSLSSERSERLSKTKTILFLSRIHPKKGLPMLLDAWAAIRPEGWKLVIAGNDEVNHTPELQTLIQKHGLAETVILAGPLYGDAKAEAFQSADLFVLPSYSENFGIVVTEALAYGLPVLTTTGCPWEELETHHCGWWVPPTPEGILSGLRAALSASNEERQRMGRRGRNLVEKNYLWPGIAERAEMVYEWIMHRETRQPEFVK